MQTPASQGKDDVEPQRAEHFAYFMIRVRRGSLDSAEDMLSGLVEQLATGEKASFASAEELIRIVRHWPEAAAVHRLVPTVEPQPVPGRPAAPDGPHVSQGAANPGAREIDDANARAGR